MSTSPLLQCDHSESVGSGSTAGRLSTRFVHELEANGTRWAVAEWSKSITSRRQDGEEHEVRLFVVFAPNGYLDRASLRERIKFRGNAVRASACCHHFLDEG